MMGGGGRKRFYCRYSDLSAIIGTLSGDGETLVVKRKLIYIACFVAFGLGLGFWSAWQCRYDTPLFLNLPVDTLGGLLAGEAIDLWVLKLPQVLVFTSVLFWGVVGTLLSVLLKPKIIAWIMGAYLVIFGGLTIWYYLD